MFHGKFNCTKTINVKKKKIVQMRPLTADIINNNRPFYRYGGHIYDLIRFKEYYRMPRGHERISFVFSSAFRDIFS